VQLELYYDLTYTVVSLVFLSPFLGYSVAALLNNSIHMRFGQRGIAILGPSCRLVTYIIFSLHPPYPVLVVAFAVTGFGNGMITILKHCLSNF
jgi:fucose permease